MGCKSRFIAVPLALTLAVALFAVSVSAETSVSRLGGRNAFHRTPLETSADATRILGELGPDIKVVLTKAGWQGLPADLHAAIAKGNWSEIQIPIGGQLNWMALRRKGEPDVITDVVLNGKEPVSAYQLQFISNEVLHTFVVPKACSNLALSAQEKLPPPIAKVSAMPATDCLTRDVNIDASGSSVSHGSYGRRIERVEDIHGRVDEAVTPTDRLPPELRHNLVGGVADRESVEAIEHRRRAGIGVHVSEIE